MSEVVSEVLSEMSEQGYEMRYCLWFTMAHPMALAAARPPDKLTIDKRNQAGALRAWKDEFEMYLMAAKEADVGD